MNDEHKFIKENGIFYTDKKLANKMVRLLKIDYKSEFTLIEPAVGEGHILSLIVKKYFIENKDKNKDEQAEFLENNIAGFDIRDEAIAVCVSKLNVLSEEYIQRKIEWNIQKFDALNRKELIEKFGTYDYVISNPPYVSRHNMDKRTITALREKSEFCSKFNFDLYYYFFEIGFDLWNRSGKIVYITPNSYIKARSGEVMMRYLIDNSLVETIIDYKDEMKFEGATTYTAISVFSTGNKVLRVKNNKGINLVKVTYRDLMEKYNYMIYSHDFLTEVQEEFIDLGEFAEIRNGLATLQDKVFIVNEKEIIEETDNVLMFMKEKKPFSVNKEVLRKVIRVSKVEEIKYVIFPYISANEIKTAYLQDTEIEEHYKETYDYLSERLDKKYQDKYGLYFGRTQGFTCYYDQKIVIPKVASLEDNPFKIVGEGFLLSGLSIKLKNEYLRTDLNQILDYLNSDVVKEYLTITSKNYAAGYKSISSNDLKKIKIPRRFINFIC
ncbi:Eco57I restriction-modification methylase domain-containing protein [Listeria welshimeri]|uniref:Eco57I restriction-modification methylase domain-containing protein n=1 Tax=Listeria welshimeri TaxID=1643 RepID=UPI001889C268|nr:Eco57I restriction-modification methylase domain-containing protein [Listeria welshimeri]MBF2638429.1 Eco57I restriction-modification methylase domain-containing protein [Listeria welshimeri]